MTKHELEIEIFQIVGDMRKVERIFQLFGKLSPEPKHKPEVPPLPAFLLKRAKRLKQRFDFTDEQRAAARSILQDLGLE